MCGSDAACCQITLIIYHYWFDIIHSAGTSCRNLGCAWALLQLQITSRHTTALIAVVPTTATVHLSQCACMVIGDS